MVVRRKWLALFKTIRTLYNISLFSYDTYIGVDGSIVHRTFEAEVAVKI